MGVGLFSLIFGPYLSKKESEIKEIKKENETYQDFAQSQIQQINNHLDSVDSLLQLQLIRLQSSPESLFDIENS